MFHLKVSSSSFLQKVVIDFTFLIFLSTIDSFAVSKEIIVSNSVEFQKALDNVTPGDNITLRGTEFKGVFVAKKNGTNKLPITIKTGGIEHNPHAIVQGQGKHVPGLTVQGNYYNLENIHVQNGGGEVAILVEGTDVLLDGLLVREAEQGVRVKGDRAFIKDCYVAKVKTGVILEADHCTLKENHFGGGGENTTSVVAGEGTCCGTFVDNTFEGDVNILGKDYSNEFNNYIGELEPKKTK